MKTAITFDLDLTDYLSGAAVADEMETCWPVFLDFCNNIPQLKTTWFIRIDAQLEQLYGAADYIFETHAEKINWLRENGHERGWHFHSYRGINGNWVQNTNEVDISEEMKKVFPLVKKHGLEILRMGWAYHKDLTLKTASDLGIRLDCSAFPRPVYSWDNPHRNWSQTGQEAYYPSTENYQITGQQNLPMLELPISSVPIPIVTDTEENVVRYINPTYHHHNFVNAVNNYLGNTLNMVAHPYEFLPNQGKHNLMAFSAQVMQENLLWLVQNGYEFATISELVNATCKHPA